MGEKVVPIFPRQRQGFEKTHMGRRNSFGQSRTDLEKRFERMIARRPHAVTEQSVVRAKITPDAVVTYIAEKIQQGLLMVPAQDMAVEPCGQVEEPIYDPL